MRDKRREKERNRARRRRNRTLGTYVHIARPDGVGVEYLVGMTSRGVLCWHTRRYAQRFTRPEAIAVLPIMRKYHPAAAIVEAGLLLPDDEREALARACEAHLVKP